MFGPISVQDAEVQGALWGGRNWAEEGGEQVDEARARQMQARLEERVGKLQRR